MASSVMWQSIHVSHGYSLTSIWYVEKLTSPPSQSHCWTSKLLWICENSSSRLNPWDPLQQFCQFWPRECNFKAVFWLCWVLATRAENWRLLPDHRLTSKFPCFTGLPVNWPVKCNTSYFDFIQYNNTPFYTVGTTEWQNHMYGRFCELFSESFPSLPWLQGNKTGTSMEFSENSFQNLLYKWFCLKWNPTFQISSSFLEKISKRELANNIYRTQKNISDCMVICKYFI